jgi:hypothetical protein
MPSIKSLSGGKLLPCSPTPATLNHNDPIDRQAAIVAAVTQNRVQWTVEHRNLLVALRFDQPIPETIPESVRDDVRLFLEMWFQGWLKEGEDVARQ